MASGLNIGGYLKNNTLLDIKFYISWHYRRPQFVIQGESKLWLACVARIKVVLHL